MSENGMSDLTAKQHIFIEEYLQSWNGTESALRAGYAGKRNTLAVIASENLRKPAIRKRIDKRITELGVGDRSRVPDFQTRALATFVYLILAENGLVKIGKTCNVAERFRQIDGISPINLRLLFVIESEKAGDIEQALHERYSDFRVKGEWFSLDAATIERIRSEYDGREWQRIN